MTEQEIRAVFDELADVVCVLSEAARTTSQRSPASSTWNWPTSRGRRIVEAKIEPASRGFSRKCPRTDTHPTYMINIALTTEFAIPGGGAWW